MSTKEHLSPVRTTHALYVVELEEFLREVDEERLDAAVCYKRAVHAHKQKRREAKLAKRPSSAGLVGACGAELSWVRHRPILHAPGAANRSDRRSVRIVVDSESQSPVPWTGTCL